MGQNGMAFAVPAVQVLISMNTDTDSTHNTCRRPTDGVQPWHMASHYISEDNGIQCM